MEKKPNFEHIATPDQIPNSLELPNDQLPQSLREFAKQNKDLTARLSVQLRRNGELELQAKKHRDIINTLKEQNEEISNNSLKNRELANMSEKELEEYKSRLKKTEIELGELVLKHRQLTEKHEQRTSEVEKRLKRFVKYRKKMQREIRPMVNRLYEQNFELLSQVREAQKDRAISKEQRQNIEAQMKRLEGKHQKKILAAAQLQDEIISTYELELKQLQNLVDTRDVEVKNAEDRVRYLEGFRDKYIVMENKAIAAERVRFETERNYDSKVNELRKQILEMTEAHKQEKEDFEKQKSILESLKDDNHELSKKYFDTAVKATSTRGEKQAHYIQWQEEKAKNKKLEATCLEITERIDALERENKKLRSKLNELENPPKLPTAIPENIVMAFEEKAKASLVKNAEEAVPRKLPESAQEKESLEALEAAVIRGQKPEFEMADLEFEDFEEIDKLIREIETGYPTKTK